ncbi:MAG: hypothetical protein QOG34_2254 [Frankiaceae bacterium]|nr:hypothetical protein [Frankiaceae bacterium]
MRRPILVRSVVVTATAALLAAGCGGGASTTSTKDPKAAFSTGMNGLNDSDVLTVTLKFDTDADTLVRLSKESGDELDPAIAKDITSAEIVFETKTTDGKKLSEIKTGDSKATASRFSFSDNGTAYAELRSRDDALYLRADVKGLLGLFNKSNVYDDLQSRASSLPAFVKAFVADQWVSVPNTVIKALTSQFAGSTGASPNPAQAQKLLADIKAVIGKDVTVARVGTDDQGDHLRLTAQSRQLLGDFVQAIGGAIPGASLALGKFKPEDVPEHSIVVDAWVSDGALAKLSLDIGQFVPDSEKKPGDTLPIVMTFDRSGDDIAKPDGATPVDLSQLGSLLGGLGA